MESTQLVVVGGGPGGYVAAFRAADLGLEVTLVEEGAALGGICLLVGCIPSKALLHVARVINEAHAAKAWGLSFGPPQLDLLQLRSWKDEVVQTLSRGVSQLCARRGIRVLQARASFLDSHTLALRGSGNVPERLRAAQIILSSGSRPAVPRGLELDDPRVMDSTAALALPDVPHRLLVVGGGYIGLELGTVYAALGSQVTIAEMTGELLVGVDRDLVRPLEQRLEAIGMTIYRSTHVTRLEPSAEGILAHLRGQGVSPLQLFHRVLVATGRRPNSDGLGLEHTAVELDARGFVKIDRQQRTRDPHILAIGDVAGEPLLAHKASREGKVAAEVAAGRPSRFDNAAIPAVVFTDPEVAWCGLSENEARARGRAVRVTHFPWGASGRARTLGRPDGLTKLIAEPSTGQILGMGVVGSGAGELIAEGTLAVEMGAVAEDLAETIHTHPTLAETIAETAEELVGRAMHIYTARRRETGAAAR